MLARGALHAVGLVGQERQLLVIDTAHPFGSRDPL